MGLLDIFKNLKEAAQEWTEGSGQGSLDRKIEKKYVFTMASYT